jgi:hypothetical protein
LKYEASETKWALSCSGLKNSDSSEEDYSEQLKDDEHNKQQRAARTKQRRNINHPRTAL